MTESNDKKSTNDLKLAKKGDQEGRKASEHGAIKDYEIDVAFGSLL